MATTTTVSVSISVVESTSTASRPDSDVDQASTTVLPASVSALHKELTCRDCGGNITPVRLHVVAYFSQHLQKQDTVHAKDKRKVKPQYYGEALTRDEMIERIEDAEREKREQKAKKSRQRKKACPADDTTDKETPPVADTTDTEIPGAKDTTDQVRVSDEDGEVCQGCGSCYRDEGVKKQRAWIGCDRCWRWFHYWCAGLTRKPRKSTEFLCEHCSVIS